jgi:hypothetical protein
VTELERLREARSFPALDDAAEQRARIRLEAAISGASAQPGRLRRHRRLAAAAGVGAALTVAALVVSALLPGRAGSPAGPQHADAARACTATQPASPHGCLLAISHLARRQALPGAGRIVYQRNLFVEAVKRFGPPGNQNSARFKSLAGAPRVFQVQRAVSEEIWLAPDGSGRTAAGKQGPAEPSSAWDAAAWRAADAPRLSQLLPWSRGFQPRTRDFPAGGVDEFYIGNSNLPAVLPAKDPLSVLPRDPTALEGWLRHAAWHQREAGPAAGACEPSLRGCSLGQRRDINNTVGTDITSFLRYPPTPPRLRAALFQVLARIPGARLLALTRDPGGRRAAAIQLPAQMNDGLDVIAFDTHDSRLLAEGSAAHGTDPAAIRWQHIYNLQTARVPGLGHRPAH